MLIIDPILGLSCQQATLDQIRKLRYESPIFSMVSGIIFSQVLNIFADILNVQLYSSDFKDGQRQHF
jgi:hypothetical protein